MTGELWIVVGALALVALVLALMGRRLARFTIEILGLKVGAEREPRARGGVRVTRSRAGRHIVADSRGAGGVTVDRSTADGDIRAAHTDTAPADGTRDGGPAA